VFPPQRSKNAPFQQRKLILDRFSDCAKARGLPVGLIAFDHYDLGDSIAAVEQINAERSAASP